MSSTYFDFLPTFHSNFEMADLYWQCEERRSHGHNQSEYC
nr:MAG TPA: hypothetical protein [Caudoviricetes sp.]